MIKIALVDDHSLIRQALKSLISSFPDMDVVIDAANGQEFLEILGHTEEPDIALIDINMPVMDGFETVQHLSTSHPKIKKIALTIENDEQSILRMIKLGAVAYILKDSEPSYLKHAIESVHSLGFFHDELVVKSLLSDRIGVAKSPKNQVVFQAREKEFLILSASDLTYKEIAEKMSVSFRTVDGYRDSLFIKLEVTSRVGLALYAYKEGFID
jgi:two-component system, NarL family, invasion response regulator UvrY